MLARLGGMTALSRCAPMGAAPAAPRRAHTLCAPMHGALLARKAPAALPAVARRAYVRESSYLGDPTGVETYSSASSWIHWAMAAGIVTIVGTVKLAQYSTAEQRQRWGWSKADLMHLHKSVALLMAAMIAPRILVRLVSFAPPLPSGSVLEHLAANASHALLYAFMLGMPASGIAMGWYSGKGLPFFGTTFKGAAVPDGKKAKEYYGLHTRLGKLFTLLLPVHIGASALHAWKGQNLFARFRFS